MFTQCPHCKTLFRISADQLKAAAGKAHCCRCDRVFSALENLQEPPAEEQSPLTLIDDFPEQQNLELPFDQNDLDDTLQETQNNLSDLLQVLRISPDESGPVDRLRSESTEERAADDERDPFEPIYDLSDTGMDSVQIGLDSQLYDGREQTEHHEPDTGSVDDEKIDADTEPSFSIPSTDEEPVSMPPPFEIPEGLPEIQPTEPAPLSLEAAISDKPRHKGGTLGWSIIILILLLVALGQLSWFGRDHLMQYPLGRKLFEQVCDRLPCQLPAERNVDKIQVVSRSISSHPEHADALLVMLMLRNDDTFEQPYPLIELSLLDANGKLVARRAFTPKEYRGSERGLMQPGIPTTVKLELQDPGAEITGYRFDFY